ncbi:hypothetical protein B0A72_19285 [Flavobacterium pectinovorum]|uniref:Uncharacterized protein n=1 Tax=Flavobacterium pectinovorum TaxID=29533 RepID=A0AB36NWK5_9FLAO|nr:hypothetical protein B0A72_19285 [Flavobacterium pectinovorum]
MVFHRKWLTNSDSKMKNERLLLKFIFKLPHTVIPRNEGSPREAPQTKSPIFVELLTEIPRSSG